MAQKQKQYLVTWEIDITASSPEAAAKQALEIQRDINSEALIFSVHEHISNSTFEIDLISENINKLDKIAYIKKVINEWGGFTTNDVEADCSPAINVLGDASILLEEFHGESAIAFSYVHSTCVSEYPIKYEDLDSDIIDDICTLVEVWEAEQDKTAKRCED